MSVFQGIKKGKLYICCEGILSKSKLSSNISNNFLKDVIEKTKSRQQSWDLRVLETIPDRHKTADEFSEDLNRFFGLQRESEAQYLGTQNVILPYTLLKNQMKQCEKEGNILICGENEFLRETMNNIGIKNFITMDEYTLLYPFLVPIAGKERTWFHSTQEMLFKQRGIKISSAEIPHRVSGVFILQNPSRWEEHCQVICDLLSTGDGSIAKEFSANPPDDHIPVYFANETLQHFSLDGSYSVFGLGMMKVALNTCYRLLYRKDIHFDTKVRFAGVLKDFIESDHINEEKSGQKVLVVGTKDTFEGVELDANFTQLTLNSKNSIQLKEGKSVKELSWAEALDVLC